MPIVKFTMNTFENQIPTEYLAVEMEKHIFKYMEMKWSEI